MARLPGQPTKRPRTTATILLELMSNEHGRLARKELLDRVKLPSSQLDNIGRQLEKEVILSRETGDFQLLWNENATTKALRYIFQAEGFPFVIVFHGKPTPSVKQPGRLKEHVPGRWISALVWSPWNRRLVGNDHFFRDRLALLFARTFAADPKGRLEDLVMIPELRSAESTPDSVVAIADVLVSRPNIIDRLVASAGRVWVSRTRVALQTSPRFYLHAFNALPFRGMRLQTGLVKLRELSGDRVIETEYWAGVKQTERQSHAVCVHVRLLAERCLAKDYSEFIQTRQLLAQLAPDWKPQLSTPIKEGNIYRVL